MDHSDSEVLACRIVVGLRPTPEIDPLLDAATKLAVAIEAELIGLYAHEDAMIDLAALPFARALEPGTARSEPLTSAAMAKAIKQGAITCRRELSVHAEKARVNWSFSAAHGELNAIIRSTVSQGDILVLSADRIGFSSRRLIEEVRRVPRDVGGILVATSAHAAAPLGPVLAIDDGDASGRATVALASRIAKVSGVPINLLVIAATDAMADRIIKRAQTLVSTGQSLEVHRVAPGNPQAIVGAFSKLQPSFIVVDKEGEPFGDDEAARTLVRAAQAPIVLVRSRPAAARSN